MVRNYYNDFETGRSLDVLQNLSKSKVNFVLIGGWAVNYYVKRQRSKDVDLAVDSTTLQYFKKKYGVQEYGISVWYSVVDGVYVDLFAQGLSDKELTIPIVEVMKNHESIEGIKVVDRNILLLLKLSGYFRDDRTKHEKDIIDVVSLLFYADIDLKKVKSHFDKYKIDERKGPMGMLEYLAICERLWEFVTSSREEYTKLSNKAKEQIDNIFYPK